MRPAVEETRDARVVRAVIEGCAERGVRVSAEMASVFVSAAPCVRSDTYIVYVYGEGCAGFELDSDIISVRVKRELNAGKTDFE